MGVSLNWLKKYVDIDWSPEELAHRLTMAGVAVEGWQEQGSDTVLELDLTPNRGDCLGLINLAREVSALNAQELRIPEIKIKPAVEKVEEYIKVEIVAPDLCPRYAARLVKNVSIKASPEWMQEALINSGIRPINNIVDITNYVMLETNQPLHAFDYNLLGDKKRILVRRAGDGEKFTTLDGVERVLDSEMLVITDGSKAVALAGIMGGENSEIQDDTCDVLLESANFLAPSIRKTSKRLGLRSDSSLRFEKGADIEGLIYALNRTAALMQDLAGGEVVQGICDIYPQPRNPLSLTLRPERVDYLLGTSISPDEIKQYLQRLKFGIKEEDGQISVDIPFYRPDIQMEVDLIEEVARLYGYGNIPASLPEGESSSGGLNSYQKFRQQLNEILAQSLSEVVNYSFINPADFDLLLLPADSPLRNVVKIANPLSEEQSVMRTLLLPGLLETIQRNLSRQNQNLAFFEMGQVFIPANELLPMEELKLGAIVSGKSELNWLKHRVELEFFFLKGIMEDLLQQLGVIDYEFKETQNPSYHPGRTASLWVKDQEIAVIGELHPLVLENYDIKERASAFELDIEKLFSLLGSSKKVESISRYPAVERDIAILLDQEIKASQVISVIKGMNNPLLYNLKLFDLYSGAQVPKGKKSMAFKAIFQSAERTLTDAEVSHSMDNLLEQLKKQLGAVLR
ncbi:MAG: phenylalanine--tRNA ligase subunit beta [Syntrophomonas sp.]|uniref:phenylalanine--tRNA ligase subunit beta n=1 Tax=Syntrophomonas sp. TaxID=2053627 RepID=UPI00261BF75F|nr:phenylalanine--tRNA ligase subunit beta [Syntrophomonas sp.]MDD4627305.1 phenylalanine--tRNA ligase subunit beta [Syntrophomonas sp.]